MKDKLCRVNRYLRQVWNDNKKKFLIFISRDYFRRLLLLKIFISCVAKITRNAVLQLSDCLCFLNEEKLFFLQSNVIIKFLLKSSVVIYFAKR